MPPLCPAPRAAWPLCVRRAALTVGLGACAVEPPEPRPLALPRASAPLVPLAEFALLVGPPDPESLACTPADPTGATVPRRTMVLRVVGDGIYDGSTRVASTTQLVTPEGTLGDDWERIHAHLKALFDAHTAVNEAHRCLRMGTPELLLELSPDLSLTHAGWIAHAASYGLVSDVWVRVEADGPTLPRPPRIKGGHRAPGMLPLCTDTVEVGWDETGAATVDNWGGETIMVPARRGAGGPPGLRGLDVAAIAAAVQTPRWAQLEYEERPPDTATVQQHVSLLATLRDDRSGAVSRGRWSHYDGYSEDRAYDAGPGEGPAVPALRWSVAGRQGCAPMDAEWVCLGYDGALHPLPPSSRSFFWVFSQLGGEPPQRSRRADPAP